MLSYRDDALPAGHPLRAVIGWLPPRATLRLPLSPLSRAAVAELARRAGRSDRSLWRITQGNPFFVTELLAAREERALPVAVRDAVLARAALLPPSARRLLDLVSVAPAGLELAVVEAIFADAEGAGEAGTAIDTASGARASAAAAEQAVDGGLLVLEGGTLRFRHDLSRRAIESALSAPRAAAWHAGVFTELARRGAPASRRVHHAALAGLGAAVLELAPEAARQAAAASDHVQAARLHALALRHADAAPATVRAALLAGRADQCMLTGRIDDAVAARLEALDLHRALGDRLATGIDRRELARLEWLRGDTKAGIPHAQAAIDELAALPPDRELAMAYATMAQLHLLGPTSRPAAEWGRKALDLLERVDDAEASAYALNTVAAAELRSADEPLAWARMERSLAIALDAGFEEHAARAWLNLASLALVHRRAGRVERACAEGIAYCDARGLEVFISRLRIRRAAALLDGGRWNDAADELAALREDGTPTTLEDEQSLHLTRLLELRRGQASADAYWSEMLSGDRRLGVDPWYAPPPVACAEAAWLRGADADVERIVRAALPAALLAGERWRIGQLGCWLQRAGRAPVELEGHVAPPCARELAGDWRGAAQAWADLACPYEQALALSGGDEAAQREALAMLTALGAAAAARIVRGRLRVQGARDVARGPYAHRRDDPLGLTARSRAVFDLVCHGLSNRAIAARLHRSERTVEHHVSALLAKLGVSTRAEAIARGAEIRVPPA
jgi:DNA-binding CsgD family transcriptional regulator